MARILLAWELGGEFGHAFACITLARSLQANGHQVALALRERRPLESLPESRSYEVFEAPRHEPPSNRAEFPASLADVLLAYGYASADDLGRLIDAWLAILGRWRPHLVICDYAPTALLAARMLGVPRATYGNGFFTPPRLDPLPAFRFDQEIPAARLRESNDRALATVNATLAARNAPALEHLADLFEADEDFLCTLPELDHYDTRPASGYWGPRLRFDRGRDVRWPTGTGPRVFAYLKRHSLLLDAFLDCLSRGPARAVVYVPGMDEATRRRWASSRCAMVDRPVKIDSVVAGCELVISHAGEMATGVLMHGVAQLVVPTHYEQYLTATRLAQLGVAFWLADVAPPEEVRPAIDRALGEPRLRHAALAFARRYPEFTPEEQRRRIVRRIGEILSARSLPASVRDPILTPPQGSGVPE